MPTHTGPWITPAPMTVGPTTWPRDRAAGLDNTRFPDFVTACETPAGDTNPASSLPPDAGWLLDPVVGYTIGQFQWPFNFNNTAFDGVGGLPEYVPPVMPPHAIRVEYDTSTSTGVFLDEVLSIHTTLTIADTSPLGLTPLDCSLRLIALHPSELNYRFVGSGLPDYHWLPGATVAARTTLGTVSIPAGTLTATLSGDLPTADIDRSHGTDRWDLLLALVFDQQVSHTAPSSGAGRRISVTDYEVTVTYQPHNYRFVYDTAPRLRQFPRDDTLGGAPRQGRASRSVQASSRQGWTGTYR